MILLQIDNISKSYAGQVIFDHVNFVIREKQKIAVIGRNGAGKSTLFHLIQGKEALDEGNIQILDHTTIGYVAQHDPFTGEEIVLDFLETHTGKPSWRCAQVAARFDFDHKQLAQTINSFSGGYQMRIKLIAMLLAEPNILLLDEPTNYLDLSTQILLEEFLIDYRGAVLLISHDREFLVRTCTETIEIEQGKLQYYPQSLEEYFSYKKEQHEWKLRYNKKLAKEKRHLQDFVDRFRAKASKATQAQSKIKQIERLKEIDIDDPEQTARIHIPTIETRKGLALRLTDVAIGYGEKVVAKDISFDINKGEHIAIVGDNGQGKSTFFKSILGDIPLLDGSLRWGKDLRIAYYAQHVKDMLDNQMTIEAYMHAQAHKDVFEEEVLRMASNFLFSEDTLKKHISVLSGGEKSRLCLAGLLLQKKDVLLLDEPTNHLDFETVEALARALKETNMTVLFISHNRTFVRLLADGIIEVRDGKIKRHLHDYDNYVYHMRKEIKEHVEKNTKSTQVPEIDQVQDAEKESKKQRKAIEEEIGKYERRKERILAWFERNSGKVHVKKQKELQMVEDHIRALEAEWMDL
ncbi:ATP-binding cassette domain-containing protein [Patescibacteria group bacterium]|nr:ATP-binding cassette domain-containing protein [Patescibacteria group bacterium]MBU1721503.1 ATP-binding cassette domain-containing protein [Patescibacteria group bacterium]MBU1900925.1 ATP-binding cassette domain-containing protein [Patescibacteria group bacterium]